MAPDRLGPGQMLEYNAHYGVLICHACQYAIQKSALQSHLLRHKIYRAERGQLLAFIAQRDILEPEDVPVPPLGSPPIDGLPVISGYRCAAPGCGHLCASVKRMKWHWREGHGYVPESSLASPAKLQTFFKGTKISYFEVTLSEEDGDGDVVVYDDAAESNNGQNYEDDDIEELEYDGLPSPATSYSTSSMNVDLETISYFHHFTSKTGLTLPSLQGPQSASQYWQTRVIPQALSHKWLMCNLLALSACHMATFPNNTAEEQQHRNRAAELASEFHAGREEFIATATDEVRDAATLIDCLLRCAHWALAESRFGQRLTPEPGVADRLQYIMTTLPASIPSAMQHHSENPETPAHALRILSWDPPEPGSFSPGTNTPIEIRDRLRDLPSQMADTFGKPENPQDVLAHLSAIAALVECCDVSFGSDEIEAAWWGMATWLAKLPPRFKHLVTRLDPAALVVVSHWAALLVNRVERCGCWYVRGLAMWILLHIADRLPQNDDGSVRRLVALAIIE